MTPREYLTASEKLKELMLAIILNCEKRDVEPEREEVRHLNEKLKAFEEARGLSRRDCLRMAQDQN
jgi:hypothetical protein